MIVFRQVDARYPFLWEDASQPAGRWHGDGEGPAHYFADTPDGAWAEFIRHEEIDDVADLPTIRRQMWAVEIGNEPRESRSCFLAAIGERHDEGLRRVNAREVKNQFERRVVAPMHVLDHDQEWLYPAERMHRLGHRVK